MPHPSLVLGAAAMSLTLAMSDVQQPSASAPVEVAAPPTAVDLPEPVAVDTLSDTADDIAGEIAVDVRDDATAEDLRDLATTYGISLRPNSFYSERDKLEIADVAPTAEAGLLDRLAQDPRVEHAEPMAVLRASFVPNDPLFAEKQWHMKKVGAEKAWDFTCGKGVTVAVVDTGVACYDKGPFSRGTDLAGTRCGDGYNFVNDSKEAFDDQGHGTHVAGTIAQTTNNGVGAAGLAYCASLMPVKVLNRYGWGTLADVAEGIRFAADNGAQVINLSLGGPGKSAILEDAVKHAEKKGVLVVAAAGNSGRAVGYPAAYPGVIAVSATDANDNIAWFSSRGPEVVIGAPGVAVTQQTICDGGKNKCEIFGTFNGTSMASPHVAGAAAMLMGVGVTDPDAVRSALEATARPKADKKLFGAGILDAGSAVARAYWGHLILRAGAMFLLFAWLARRAKRTGGKLTASPGVVFGALLGGVGLLPIAPLFGLAAHAGKLRTLVELAMRPLGEWDLLLGVDLHRWIPLASALPTMAMTAFLFGSRRARPVLGGFAVGAAALLAQMAYSADLAFPLGSVALRLWAVANAALCVWIARIALDKKLSA